MILMQKEIESYGWLTVDEFIDILAIAEMTPGALAVTQPLLLVSALRVCWAQWLQQPLWLCPPC